MSNKTVSVGRRRVHHGLRRSRKASCKKWDFELGVELKNKTRRVGWKGHCRQEHSTSKGKEAGTRAGGSGCHEKTSLGGAEFCVGET